MRTLRSTLQVTCFVRNREILKELSLTISKTTTKLASTLHAKMMMHTNAEEFQIPFFPRNRKILNELNPTMLKTTTKLAYNLHHTVMMHTHPSVFSLVRFQPKSYDRYLVHIISWIIGNKFCSIFVFLIAIPITVSELLPLIIFSLPSEVQVVMPEFYFLSGGLSFTVRESSTTTESWHSLMPMNHQFSPNKTKSMAGIFFPHFTTVAISFSYDTGVSCECNVEFAQCSRVHLGKPIHMSPKQRKRENTENLFCRQFNILL